MSTNKDESAVTIAASEPASEPEKKPAKRRSRAKNEKTSGGQKSSSSSLKAGRARSVKSELSEIACANLKLYVKWLQDAYGGQEPLASMLATDNKRTIQPLVSRWVNPDTEDLPSPAYFDRLAMAGGFNSLALKNLLEQADFLSALSAAAAASTSVELKISMANELELARLLVLVSRRMEAIAAAPTAKPPEAVTLSLKDIQRLESTLRLTAVSKGRYEEPELWVKSLPVSVRARDLVYLALTSPQVSGVDFDLASLDEISMHMATITDWDDAVPQTITPGASPGSGRQLLEHLRREIR